MIPVGIVEIASNLSAVGIDLRHDCWYSEGMNTDIITTYVWTDGLGTFQGRCYHCQWHGRWIQDEDKAAIAAKLHGRMHAETHPRTLVELQRDGEL